MSGRFYLVSEDILPDGIQKTIKIKELLRADDRITIQDACRRYDLSRSSFYKYKDDVFPFYEASRDKIVSMSLMLEHKNGVLSHVLNAVSSEGCSVITINQGIPLQGVALTTLSVDTKALSIEIEALFDKIRMVDGVKRLEVLGQN